MDVANSVGAEAVLAVIKPRESASVEPPQAVAMAMKSVNVLFTLFGRGGLAHTNARMEATAAGVRVHTISGLVPDYLQHEVTKADLEQIKECTERLAQKLTNANHARVTTPAGTDLTMSLEGREALPINPMWEVLGTMLDYAEVAISPVEGTAEGILIIDILAGNFGYSHKEPIKCVVKSGRLVEISGGENAEGLRRIVATDENSSNFAELGIGTSHIMARKYLSTRRGGGMIGTAHIGIGRNNDIGGQTWSRTHTDGMMNCPTIELDGEVVARDSTLV
jgi:leucyl aminopeptidase (aminopeptidase T)